MSLFDGEVKDMMGNIRLHKGGGDAILLVVYIFFLWIISDDVLIRRIQVG